MSSELMHYGILRRSGRYPWGSGGEIVETSERLAASGLSETEIAKSLGMSTTELRNQKTLIKAARREEERLFVTRLKESGMSIAAISEEADLPKSTVNDLLKPNANAKFQIIKKIAEVLKRAVARFKYIDIGEGVELYLGVSETKLKNAVTLLKNEGYTVHYLREEQMGTGKKTSHMVLAGPSVTFEEVLANKGNIQLPTETSIDRGHTYTGIQPIVNVAPSRIAVNFAEDGGSNKDGIIELRPNTPDLSIGGKRYAQVRIGVEGDRYIKGVAVYSDDLPDGVDIRFNTNKKASDFTDDPLGVLKDQKLDGANPFGAAIKPQNQYLDANGVKRTSAVNIVNEEGDWATWSNSLASQFLSKQSTRLAKQQLDIDRKNLEAELAEILSITEPTVRNHLLQDFAETADAKAEMLKAAAMPRQTTAVLIPSESISPTEVFAPNYNNGESVVLVRYPHGGIFEIPTLTVNNKNPEMRKLIGSDSPDAIGIHPDVAKRLSGADFDGDFVLVIPNQSGKVRTSPSLIGLKDFDPILSYPKYDGMVPMTDNAKEIEMGKVSNLITDMTLKGANEAEIARAVRHSMVVIDAPKHELNYRQSYIDNGIAALKKTYQGAANAGAGTIISRASSEQRVPHRKDYFQIDPETGEKIHVYSGETYINKKGAVIERQTKSTKMRENAPRDLSSGTVMESVYVDYAESMKSMANRARLETTKTIPSKRDPAATKAYQPEVKKLEASLRVAMKHQPLERKAQLVANEIYSQKLKANPTMTPRDKKTEKGRALVAARTRLGIKKPVIDITPREWEAIQMGALSPTMVRRILRNANEDQIRALAIPRTPTGLSSAKTLRAQALLKSGYTNAEVALSLGVPVGQIQKLKTEEGL